MGVGKAEDHEEHDSDHFHFTCWKADAILREGQMLLLERRTDVSSRLISTQGPHMPKSKWENAGGGGGGGDGGRFDYIIQTEVGVMKKQETIC